MSTPETPEERIASLEKDKERLQLKVTDLDNELSSLKIVRADVDQMRKTMVASDDLLRTKLGELAGERDRWKAKAEKAEVAIDPVRLDSLHRCTAAALKQAADLQRELAAVKKTIAQTVENAHDHAARAAKAERDRDAITATFEGMQRARDGALARAAAAEAAVIEEHAALERAEGEIDGLRRDLVTRDRVIAGIRRVTRGHGNAALAILEVARVLGPDPDTKSVAQPAPATGVAKP